MSRPNLDHIVILISHDALLTLSDHLQDHFVIAPGGTHADGLTSNKLILLPDGVYLESIAFAKDAAHQVLNEFRGPGVDAVLVD